MRLELSARPCTRLSPVHRVGDRIAQRLLVLLLVGTLLGSLLPLQSVTGSITTSFADGKSSQTLTFTTSGTKTVGVLVEDDATVNKAGFDIDGQEVSFGEGYPSDVSVDVGADGSVDWAFKGTGVGAAGHQYMFKDGKTVMTVDFTNPQGGTDASSSILLPKSAKIKDASIWIKGNGTAFQQVAGKQIKGPMASENFGWAGANVGDVNKDGWDDLLVGTMKAPKAYLYSGGPGFGGASSMTFSGMPGSNFGTQIAALGDVNNDGFDDFAIAENTSLSVKVYFGGPGLDNVPDMNLTAMPGSTCYGYAVAGGSDLDGDGFNDIAVSDYFQWIDDRGVIYIYKGGPALDNVSDYKLEVAQDVPLGYSLATGGDINGDGWDDLIAGDPDLYQFMGSMIYIFKGGPGLGTTPISKAFGLNSNDLFGWDISIKDDINGDDFDDIVVGAPGDGAGKVYLYWGKNTWPAIVASSATISGKVSGDLFGYSVASLGDLNSDSMSELLIGAPYAGGASYSGAAYIINGSTSPGIQKAIEIPGGNYAQTGAWVEYLGDIANDGGKDFLVSSIGSNANRGDVQIYRPTWGLGTPAVTIGGLKVLGLNNKILNTTTSLGVSATELQAVLDAALILGTDTYGNQFSELAVGLSAGSAGTMEAFGLSINYTAKTSMTMSLANAFNSYLAKARASGATGEKINVPINITSITTGKLVLSGLLVDWTANKAPVAYIDTADPRSIESGALVTLVGRGTDADVGSSIVAYQWTSDLEGVLDSGPSVQVGLNVVGIHTISLKVQDNKGRWSEPATVSIEVVPKDTAPTVTVESPTEGRYVSKLVLITGHAMDIDVGDTLSVWVQIDAGPWSEATGGSGGSAWVFTWDTANETDGPHTIRARSYDGRLYSAEALVNVTVTHPVPEVKVTPPSSMQAYPGERITFYFNVSNSGTDAGDFDIKLRTTPTVRYELTTRTVHIAAGNWTSIKVSIYADITVKPPTDIEVGLKASVVGMAITDEGVLMVHVVPKPPNPADQGAYIEAPLDATVKRGTSVSYIFKLRNTGTSQDSYDIAATSKDGWKVTVSMDGSPISGPVQLDAGKAVDLTVTMDVPKDAKPKTTHELNLNARSVNFQNINVTRTVRTTVQSPAVQTTVVSLPVVTVAVVIVVAVSGTIGAIVLGTEWGTFGLFWLLLPLYSRLKKEAVLDNFKRGEINAFIKLNPGTYYNEIKKNLEVSNGVLTYHLNRLEMEGYIKSKINGRYKHYFPSNMKTPENIVMLNDLQRALLKFIRDKRWVTQAEISEQLDIPLPTVSRHLKRLMEAQMVRVERRGNLNYYGVAGDWGGEDQEGPMPKETPEPYLATDTAPTYHPEGYPSGYQAMDGQGDQSSPDYDPAGYKYYQPPDDRPPGM